LNRRLFLKTSNETGPKREKKYKKKEQSLLKNKNWTRTVVIDTTR